VAAPGWGGHQGYFINLVMVGSGTHNWGWGGEGGGVPTPKPTNSTGGAVGTVPAARGTHAQERAPPHLPPNQPTQRQPWIVTKGCGWVGVTSTGRRAS
jgi:hypothetical protein